MDDRVPLFVPTGSPGLVLETALVQGAKAWCDSAHNVLTLGRGGSPVFSCAACCAVH